MSENKHVSKWQQFIKENLEETSIVKLKEISKIEDFPEEIQNMLKDFYSNSSSLSVQKIATILNAIFTQNNGVFLMTYRVVNNLLKKDFNIEVNSCNASTYSYIRHTMIKSNMIEQIREPIANKGGLYELKSKMFRDMLVRKVGDEYLEAQKRSFLSWYDDEKNFKKIEDKNEGKLISLEEIENITKSVKTRKRIKLEDLEK